MDIGVDTGNGTLYPSHSLGGRPKLKKERREEIFVDSLLVSFTGFKDAGVLDESTQPN